MATPRFQVGIALAAIVFFTPGVSLAEVPTAKDFASCNEKAKQEMETASASPRTDSGARVASSVSKRDAAGGMMAAGAPSAAPKQQPANTGKPLTKTEADPQLQGIDPEGEKDPAYIAAYKKCMRQGGF
jgi:hypothetical protein